MSSLIEIPLPNGWERKFNQNANRHYYVDHINRRTQWEDPRLHDEQIWWEEERKEMLGHLKIMFKDVKEETLREALIETGFVEWDAVEYLSKLGHSKSSHSTGSTVTGQSSGSALISAHGTIPQNDNSSKSRTGGKRGSVRVQDPKDSAGKENSDHFLLMHMKASFPETSDDTLLDILHQCGNNLNLAIRELRNMGYSGRQKVGDRLVESVVKTEEMEKAKKERQKEEREQSVRQLKQEFESFLDADISNTFEKSKFDLYETRSSLRRMEADKKLQALSSTDSGPVAVDNVTVDNTGSHSRPSGKNDTTQPEIRQSETVQSEGESGALSLPKSVTRSISQRQSFEKGPDQLALRRGTVAEIGQLEIPSKSKSTGTTPSHQIGSRLSSAKGPDPKLRRGSDPNLRIGGHSRAMGPDPNLRKGPNPQLRSGVGCHHATVIKVQ